MKKCKHPDGCPRPVRTNGWCNMHRLRISRTGNPGPVTSLRRGPKPKIETSQHPEGCEREHRAKGFCELHYGRLLRTGSIGPLSVKKAKNGSGHIAEDGYKEITIDGRRTTEHRYIFEQYLGRSLEEWENIHHKNGVRDDNRMENLELWAVPQPKGQRVEDLVEWIIDIYPDLTKEMIEAREGLNAYT